jgi:transcriptional enhancer factor
MLRQSDKYQKYREKQPAMTPTEVIERDAAERQEMQRREAEGIQQEKKDSTVWPGFLEHAFWRGMLAHCYDMNFTCLFFHHFGITTTATFDT